MLNIFSSNARLRFFMGVSRRTLLHISCFFVVVCCILPGASAFASQAGKEFNEADADLNVTYQKVLAKMKDPEDRALFIAAQRAWVQYRDANVKFNARYYPESKGGLFLNTRLTQERANYFRQLLSEPPDKAR